MLSQLYSRKGSDAYISFGLAMVLLFFVASTYVSYHNTRTISEDSQIVTRTHETIAELNKLLSLAKDAETGQRGYVITGDEKYLAPYNSAVQSIDDQMMHVEQIMKGSPEQAAVLPLIKQHIDAKMAELAATVELRRTKGFQAAYDEVVTDRGKNEMDIVRGLMKRIDDEESSLRVEDVAEMDRAFHLAMVSGILTGIIGIIISGAVAFLVRRNATMQKRADWLNTGQVKLSASTFGELQLQHLGENILTLLADYIGAQAGLLFVKENGNFQRVASYGVPVESRAPKQFTLDDGMLGQAVKTNQPMTLSDVPDDYLYYGSAMGQSKPRHLLIFPVTVENGVNAVLELGFSRPVQPIIIELLHKASETIGMAVRSVIYRASLQNFLEETQRQSEELQAQSEELKVSNEELEEQSRALKESQARLELQQVETEQTNAQLEEQTQMLEQQRDDLERTADEVQIKARELEQASQYKSNFLANMSHELRTPLNSSLILAKLLADNPDGNLSAEQVRYAQTIQASGNDLLTLINDILDLSKIEAGHMEIRAEPMPVIRLTNDLTRMFEPVAKQKNLTFRVSIAPDCPENLVSDRQRLEQVLKNLISNAIKFTEKGKVELTVSCSSAGIISFAVSDTGIGIAPEQQQAIFDAFKQADGTISRKYGGTGLGLSISREMARLLGGHIELKSEPGKGSIFSVLLPKTYRPEHVQPAKYNAVAPPETPSNDMLPEKPMPGQIPDDRENLKPDKRTLLIIEDDESFARILQELSHELGFQSIICMNAEEALIAAKQFLPSAVLLDVGLPDHSGLVVLDRIKHDKRTRHIPVHVISAEDYSQKALSLGAAGYMLKPVKREQLTEELKRIEARFSQNMRRVLIVEDDKTQREALKKLLQSCNVQTVEAGTAAECLERLKEGTFDCMVLDLSLPDASGYSLLETLSKEDAYSFPPVIVYTGRDLSSDEEQRLRRYSTSIIIKGAKSPERLLDEVTLFLHQVVSEMPPEKQRMLEKAKSRDSMLEGKNILIVEDDVRNVYAVTSILEPQGARVMIARNGREGIQALENAKIPIDLVLMDVMMPEMDGLTATREIRKRREWTKLPVIMLTAKAMKDDQEKCLAAGANDYMAKPLDVEKLLSLVRVWVTR